MIRIKEDICNSNDNNILADKFSEIFSHINAIIALAHDCPQYEELVLAFEKLERRIRKGK